MNKKNGNTPESIATNSQTDFIKEIAHSVLLSSSSDNTAAIQRERVIKALRLAGRQGITTIQFREHFDVMAPAPRVFELRRDGVNILTAFDNSVNAQDKKHRNARYILINSDSSANEAA